jgi:hypothetical protein
MRATSHHKVLSINAALPLLRPPHADSSSASAATSNTTPR